MKKIALAALWLLATAAAIAIASAGVGIVSDEVIRPAPDLIGASIISEPPAESIPAPPSTTSTTPEAPETLETPEVSATSAPPTTEAPTGPTTTVGSLITVTTTAPPAGPTTTVTSTTTVVPTTTTVPPPTTTTTEAPSSTFTFQLEGGTTAISFSPTSVTAVWATPKLGFEVDIETEGDGVKVEFHSDTHRSTIEAWWDGGPQQDISEEPEND